MLLYYFYDKPEKDLYLKKIINILDKNFQNKISLKLHEIIEEQDLIAFLDFLKKLN
ncbi:MAG: hypothetical protein GY830_10795 [Bacteroidetes bacterium]|nr:hypothetical protein [Bacteroidota bacterium]